MSRESDEGGKIGHQRGLTRERTVAITYIGPQSTGTVLATLRRSEAFASEAPR